MTEKIKARFDHLAKKQILKEKYEAKMIFAEYDGMWKASPELINVLNIGYKEIMYLEDLYGNPCKVPRLKFLSIVQERWQEMMNKWHDEFLTISKER